MLQMSFRVKKRADIIGAFKMDPLYLKHDHQESGISAASKQYQHCRKWHDIISGHDILSIVKFISHSFIIRLLQAKYKIKQPVLDIFTNSKLE